MSSLFLNKLFVLSLTQKISAFTLALLNMKSLIFDFKQFFIMILIILIVKTAPMDDSLLFLNKTVQLRMQVFFRALYSALAMVGPDKRRSHSSGRGFAYPF